MAGYDAILSDDKELAKTTRSKSCSGPPAFKSQRVGYQSNQKLLHHHQHQNNQLYSYIHS